MDFRKLGLVALLATMLVTVAGVGTATAHKGKYPTRVVIGGGGPEGANGRVVAKEESCLGDRQVSLYFRDPASHKLVLVGTATTDADGNWSIEAELFAGQYVAKVSSSEIMVHGEPHSCKRGRSGTKRL